MQEEINKRVLVIHPEGNIQNNPHLSGLTEILAESGFAVDVFSEKRHFSQDLNPGSFKLILRDRLSDLEEDYSLVISVDLGVIEGSIISMAKGIPLVYISYEIFFEDEIGRATKDMERSACRYVDFAITQDLVRAEQLSRENRIPMDKILTMPVAGRFFHPRVKSFYLHDRLGISKEKKIALITGSLSGFTCTKEIVDTVKDWPDDWALVLHDRYGRNKNVEKRIEKLNGGQKNRKIFLSDLQTGSTEGLTPIIHSADIGLAFYRATGEDFYTGQNIGFIGWASGKIGTYLQNGLPVVTNSLGAVSKFTSDLKLGASVKSVKELPALLKRISSLSLVFAEQAVFRAQFESHVSINSYSEKIIALFGNLIQEKEQKQLIQDILSIVQSDLYLRNLWQARKIQKLEEKAGHPVRNTFKTAYKKALKLWEGLFRRNTAENR